MGGLQHVLTFSRLMKLFLHHTRVENFSKFHLDAIIEEICMDENVISSSEVLLEDVIVEMNDNEIGEQVLLTMIKLYVRVRAFSHAKK